MEKRYQRTADDMDFITRLDLPTISYSEAIILIREIISRHCVTISPYWIEIVVERDKSILNYCLSAAVAEFELTFNEAEELLDTDKFSPIKGKGYAILGKTSDEEEEKW